jgi:methionyl-tRNA formyltransferase
MAKHIMNIIFAGSPEFALPSFNEILNTKHKIAAVYTQPDRPAGRGRTLSPTIIKSAALEHNIPVHTPNNFKDQQTIDQLKQYSPDIIVVVAYGILLPQEVLDIPRFGCINLHPSLLPKWRGATPVQYTLLHGDKSTGVTIIQMEKGMDSGPILLQQTSSITPNETSKTLLAKLAIQGGLAITKTLNNIESYRLSATTQQHHQPLTIKLFAYGHR